MILGLFKGLLDLGFLEYFVNSNFVTKNGLTCQKIAPIPIELIDSTVNTYVTRIVLFSIKFSCGYFYIPKFFVTKLKGTYSVKTLDSS